MSAGPTRRALLGGGLAFVAGLVAGRRLGAVGKASRVELAQLVYAGGNFRPRVAALRSLAWEVHKRTAVEVGLEPREVRAQVRALAETPFVYLSGDRGMTRFEAAELNALERFLRLGGFLLIDPALDPAGHPTPFTDAARRLLATIAPGVALASLPPDHVLYRSFYNLDRPVGRVEGPATLDGLELDGRLAAVLTAHDLGAAWARDELGTFAYEVAGGPGRREQAIRLGVNLVLAALCLDYKNEEPHRRFGRPEATGT